MTLWSWHFMCFGVESSNFKAWIFVRIFLFQAILWDVYSDSFECSLASECRCQELHVTLRLDTWQKKKFWFLVLTERITQIWHSQTVSYALLHGYRFSFKCHNTYIFDIIVNVSQWNRSHIYYNGNGLMNSLWICRLYLIMYIDRFKELTWIR